MGSRLCTLPVAISKEREGILLCKNKAKYCSSSIQWWEWTHFSFSCHTSWSTVRTRLWNTEALITGKHTNLEQKAPVFVSGGPRGRRATGLTFLSNKYSSLGCPALYPLQQFALQARDHKNAVKPRHCAQINNFSSPILNPFLLFLQHQQNPVTSTALLHSTHSDFKTNHCTSSSSTRMKI